MAYNPVKRLYNWFFDNNIPTEPRTYIDSNGNNITKQVKTRFAKGHFPKEESFKDLLHTTFLKSAGTDLQDIATTDNIYNKEDVEKVVKPNQLPDLSPIVDSFDINVETFGNPNTAFNNNVYEVIETKNTKLKYSWKFTSSFIDWLRTKFIPKGGTSGQVLKKQSNSDYAVEWANDSTGTNLPAFSGANRILFTDPTNTSAEWRIRDYYTQTESNTLLNTEITNRTNTDAAIQNELNVTQLGSGLNTNGTYNPSVIPLISPATSLSNADDILAQELIDIRNGAVLPTSSLSGLQSQINALTPLVVSSPVTLSVIDNQGKSANFTYIQYGKLIRYSLLINTPLVTAGTSNTKTISFIGLPPNVEGFLTLSTSSSYSSSEVVSTVKVDVYISLLGGVNTYLYNNSGINIIDNTQFVMSGSYLTT